MPYYTEEHFTENRPKKKKRFLVLLGTAIFGIAIIIFLVPANSFSAPGYFSVSAGESLGTLSNELVSAHLIHSELLFKSLVVILGAEKKIIPGDYYFKRPPSTIEVVRRVSTGDFGIEQIKITFPEGMTRYEIGQLLATKYPDFSSSIFMDLTKNKEGYLFPSTYFFSPIATEEIITLRMEQEFTRQTSALEKDASLGTRNWSDVIKMASIIEAEAGGSDDRATIAGILWKRLDKGMYLQVDAPFAYILHKTSAQLTVYDLALDSLYNTYTHSGLPPTPIGNPGLSAITAAVQPKDSLYYFYLHDENGTIHYAKTFAEHKANIAKYLR